MFVSEQEMSKAFEKYSKIHFGKAYIKEYSGLFGIPDFVFYTKRDDKTSIISFELKLKDWKRATTQAFRYKSFSNIVYVVLPSQTANLAFRNIDFFKKYNIGLAKLNSQENFEILFKPREDSPYSESLYNKITLSVSKCRKKMKNLEILT